MEGKSMYNFFFGSKKAQKKAEKKLTVLRNILKF